MGLSKAERALFAKLVASSGMSASVASSSSPVAVRKANATTKAPIVAGAVTVGEAHGHRMFIFGRTWISANKCAVVLAHADKVRALLGGKAPARPVVAVAVETDEAAETDGDY